MATTFAFDVYGTLIDTNGVVVLLNTMVGDLALAFSQTWRDKQLEYSFRRGLMKNYQSFAVCTHDALRYTCEVYQVTLTEQQIGQLLEKYQQLPTFDDVKPALSLLKQTEVKLFAFSNGSKEAVSKLLSHAGIRDYFAGIISCESLKSFKPDPAVYTHFLQTTNTLTREAWLISSNPFDIIGARSVGMHAAWIKRSSHAIFDPWDLTPNLTLSSLSELEQLINTSEI